MTGVRKEIARHVRKLLIYSPYWYTILSDTITEVIFMSEDFGSDFITIVDDDGTEFELELLDTMDYKGQTFVAFLPADMDENDPDYGLVILRSVIDENGDELFESIDDEDELQDVYEHFAVLLFDDEDEE